MKHGAEVGRGRERSAGVNMAAKNVDRGSNIGHGYPRHGRPSWGL